MRRTEVSRLQHSIDQLRSVHSQLEEQLKEFDILREVEPLLTKLEQLNS